jgi:CubicO group peptidase (beta-lactamase class C family)
MIPQKISFLLFAFLLFFTSNCKDDFLEIPTDGAGMGLSNETNDFESDLKEEMNQQKIPGLSILIFEGDNIKYNKNFGKSNVEEDLDLEGNHLFLLASISKAITATALLQLYDKDLFSLEDAINDYLPFEVKVPHYDKEITFRMLLTHTSGIADGDALDDQYYYGEDSPVELDYFLENYLVEGGQFYNANQNFHDFEPGTEHEYSNEGAALIAVLVEAIAEQEFNAYCKEHIFQPLKMNHTFWRLDEINQIIAQPYNYVDGKYEAIPHYTFTDYPNGGLRSTTTDLYQFAKTLANKGKSGSFQLLKASTVEEMMQPQIPNLEKSMGLHLFLMNESLNLWGHDGGEEGTSTMMAFNPNNKIGTIIFANKTDANLDDLLVKAYQFGQK